MKQLLKIAMMLIIGIASFAAGSHYNSKKKVL